MCTIITQLGWPPERHSRSHKWHSPDCRCSLVLVAHRVRLAQLAKSGCSVGAEFQSPIYMTIIKAGGNLVRNLNHTTCARRVLVGDQNPGRNTLVLFHRLLRVRPPTIAAAGASVMTHHHHLAKDRDSCSQLPLEPCRHVSVASVTVKVNTPVCESYSGQVSVVISVMGPHQYHASASAGSYYMKQMCFS